MNKILEFFKDLSLQFSECKRCRHKRYCNHRVWINPYDDCNYWMEMKERTKMGEANDN